MENIYFDYAATTPVDARVLEAMLPYFNEKFGNSSSLHSHGRQAKKALDESRVKIANALNSDKEEVFFTSSATESNNTVIKGIASKGDHIIISAVEHDCIVNSAKYVEEKGVEVTILPVDKYGMVTALDVEKAIKKNTVLVSVIHGNNEIGTINPISEIALVCKEKGVIFHTDASQSLGKIPINVKEMNIDILTASSHKMYGPKGVALLYLRKGIQIEPLIHGGGHEKGLRSSTVNVSAIVGFAKAVEICMEEMISEKERQEKLRDIFIENILKKIPTSYLNGHPKQRLPNNMNMRFDFVEGEAIVIGLDAEGVSVSTASACSSPKLEPSHVLTACGLKAHEAHGAIRLSIGRFTKKQDIDYVVDALSKVIRRLRKISPFKEGEVNVH